MYLLIRMRCDALVKYDKYMFFQFWANMVCANWNVSDVGMSMVKNRAKKRKSENLWVRNKVNYVRHRKLACSPLRTTVRFVRFRNENNNSNNRNMQLSQDHGFARKKYWLALHYNSSVWNINLLSAATIRLACELLSGRRVALFAFNNKITFRPHKSIVLCSPHCTAYN